MANAERASDLRFHLSAVLTAVRELAAFCAHSAPKRAQSAPTTALSLVGEPLRRAGARASRPWGLGRMIL